MANLDATTRHPPLTPIHPSPCFQRRHARECATYPPSYPARQQPLDQTFRACSSWHPASATSSARRVCPADQMRAAGTPAAAGPPSEGALKSLLREWLHALSAESHDRSAPQLDPTQPRPRVEKTVRFRSSRRRGERPITTRRSSSGTTRPARFRSPTPTRARRTRRTRRSSSPASTTSSCRRPVTATFGFRASFPRLREAR